MKIYTGIQINAVVFINYWKQNTFSVFLKAQVRFKSAKIEKLKSGKLISMRAFKNDYHVLYRKERR